MKLTLAAAIVAAMAVAASPVFARGSHGGSTHSASSHAQDIPTGPFDLIYSSMTLHHIDDVATLFRRVYERLAPTGRVAFADLALEDGTFHADGVPGVMHHGFEAATLLDWLTVAGFVDVQARTAHVVKKTRADGSMREYPVLLITAQRPVASGAA